MMGFTTFLLLNTAQAQSCMEVANPGEQTQVAWISPLTKRVVGNGWIEVVPVSELRRWVQEQGPETARLLQGLGMKGRRVRALQPEDYKITIFDVDSSWLCRPIEGGVPGEDYNGVAICETKEQGARWGHHRGYTGCGYSLDTGASNRGLDVYRVRWSDVSAWGFCVLPMERFLKGA